MIRLLGVLTGSAIALALLIVAIGVPEFSPRPAAQKPEPGRDFAAQSPTQPAEPEVPVASATLEPLPEPEAPVAPATLDTRPQPAPIALPAAPENSLSIEPPQENILTEESSPAADVNWYAFWSPFRSEIAADGFVAELQRTTGLDYRVVRLKPGVYEVAFAYLDESDIQEKLTRISTATGLDMSGG